jgi:DNA (cytosine-5)-methyltransferase 1
MWDGTAAYPLPTLALVTSVNDGGFWPTPTRKGNYNRPYPGKKSGYGLVTAVRMWPTPLKRDSRTVKGAARSPNSLGTEPLVTEVALSEGLENGRLNPEWVEWLMGWPMGWTDASKPLAMDKFREWWQQHSPSYQTTEESA